MNRLGGGTPRRFNRRQTFFVLLAPVLLVLGGLGSARAEDADMVEFVRDLFARELDRHDLRAPISDAAFFAMFASDLRTLMQAPRSYTGPEGRILNVFFGWGVLPGQPVKIVQVVPVNAQGRNLVRVELLARGEPRHSVLRLTREDGLWKIADISYDSGESLRTYFQQITGR